MLVRFYVLMLVTVLALLGTASASGEPLAPPERTAAETRIHLPLVQHYFDPFLYDNFQNPAYDGAWNPALWTAAEWNQPWVRMQQQNGALVLWNTTPSEAASGGQLLVKNALTREPGDVWWVEARMKLSSDRQGGLSTVQLKAHSVFENGPWTASCTLGGSPENAWARFSCRVLGDSYEPREVQLPYDRWHVVRIEIMPGTAELRFYLNGNLLETRVPDDAAWLKDATEMEPNIQLWNASANATSTRYVDDVRISRR